jgi:hypothetical protein
VALTQVRKGGLWTPEGIIDVEEKDVLHLSPDDVRAFSWLQVFIARHKLKVSLVCNRCNHAITGTNNDSSKVLSMACRCTEWRLDGR